MPFACKIQNSSHCYTISSVLGLSYSRVSFPQPRPDTTHSLTLGVDGTQSLTQVQDPRSVSGTSRPAKESGRFLAFTSHCHHLKHHSKEIALGRCHYCVRVFGDSAMTGPFSSTSGWVRFEYKITSFSTSS